MWIFCGLLILSSTRTSGQSPIIDSRCYLEGGGSAESFLASEDLTVGSVIGTLRINGNPADDLGDINLRLRERDAVVEIAAGSKDLVLKTALDKEGVVGPSSVYVNVICDRRHSTDPSFVIPVNIRVTDVNDNAPQWVGAPYSLPLSEVTVPGTRILQGARAIDKDQQGPFNTVEYQIVPGPHSDFVAFVSPLAGTLVLRKPLDYETLPNFTVTLRAQDHGTPPKFSDTQLHVLVEDADDQNPKFLQDAYRAELPSDTYVGVLAVQPDAIRAVDQDEGLRAPVQYAIVPSMESRHFAIGARSGEVSVVSPLGGLSGLVAVTLVVRATQINNADRYALTTLVVSGKEDPKALGKPLAFLQPQFHVKIPENTGPGQRLLALPTNRPGRYLRYAILDAAQSAYFAVGTLGEIILQQPLDYERTARHTFDVLASDGRFNATAEVNIDVTDVNDWEPRFRHSHYEFVVPASALAVAAAADDDVDDPDSRSIRLGKLEAADGDANDAVHLSIGGAFAQYVHVDGDGVLWLRAAGALPANATRMHLIATATDTGVPPRSSSVPVTVIVGSGAGGTGAADTAAGGRDGMLLSAQRGGWTDMTGGGVLGTLGVVLVATMVVIIVAMAVYIYGQARQRSAKNRVHSSSSGAGSEQQQQLHGNEQRMSGASTAAPGSGKSAAGRMQSLGHGGGVGSNIRLVTPQHGGLNNNNVNGGDGGGGLMMLGGANAVLAANMDREAQRQREKDNYTATVRSIISRASAAHGGLFDMPGSSAGAHDQPDAQSEIDRRTSPPATTAWNITPRNPNAISSPGENEVGVLQRSIKKLSWSQTNNASGQRNEVPSVLSKQDFLGSTDNMTAAENNLTVYF